MLTNAVLWQYNRIHSILSKSTAHTEDNGTKGCCQHSWCVYINMYAPSQNKGSVLHRCVCGGRIYFGERGRTEQRATSPERCQCNLSIASCPFSCSKLWSVSIDQRKNLLPLTFDSSIDHFLLYTVERQYSDSTQGLVRSLVITLADLLCRLPHFGIRVFRLYLSLWSYWYPMNFTNADQNNSREFTQIILNS